MKKKLLAAAIVMAGALVLPTMAAQDTSGMRYTSASEGFYASLRVQFNSGGKNTDSAGNVTDNGAGIENSSSRFGVRGTNDLGDGWQGFYQYEAGVEIDDGGSLSTRLAHVGVRGGFGQLQVGTFWPASYSWVHGSTDVANWASGSFIHEMLLPGRQSRALEYTTPDLNGFQAAAFIEMDPNRDGEGALGGPGTPGRDAMIVNLFTEQAISAAVDANERDKFLVARVMGMSESGLFVFVSIDDPVLVADLMSPIPNTITVRETSGVNIRVGSSSDVVNLMSLRHLDNNGNNGFDQGASGDYVIFGVREITDAIAAIPGNPKDDNDIDLWSLSAKYSFHGFDTGISYTVVPDGIEKSSGSRKDLSLYALRFGYAQDNWYVTSWYAEDNAGDDVNRDHDTETFSLAAGIAVGKANLYAVYETQESDNYEPETATAAAVPSTGSHEDESATVGVQYRLSSRSRVWIEYASRDYDSADVDDYTTIGLRHDL